MWSELLKENRDEYKRMIIAFASLSEMFSQKNKGRAKIIPIINSKYQETVFHRAFNASIEDIGNTSFDASINIGNKKFLVGIKTFRFNSDTQKVAQFKANHEELTPYFSEIKRNSNNKDGTVKTKEEIDLLNRELYLNIARRIAYLRNKRIESSKANLRGFVITNKSVVESVYHVLMPTIKDEIPCIIVGETPYNTIDIDSIEILGCSTIKCPTNFGFKDRYHEYRFTSADSQLLMNFNNSSIEVEKWNVTYHDDPYQFFANLADLLFKKEEKEIVSLDKNGNIKPRITESYSWSMLNKKGDVEMFSGLNGFYGVGSKLGKESREKAIKKISKDYEKEVNECENGYFINGISRYLSDRCTDKKKKIAKVNLRNELMNIAKKKGDDLFLKEVSKILFRPVNEGYIPIPNSREFHKKHPDFFIKGGLAFNQKGGLIQSKAEREFNLIFEPSGNKITSFIAQDWGKAIESTQSMSILGKWILREVFQLQEYEPITAKKLEEVGINGMRLYKTEGSDDIHLQFIWIDKEDKPKDLWR